MPGSGSPWHTSHDHQLHSVLHQNQRVLHTQVFKEVTVGQGAIQQRQLMVTETDNAGTERLRRPEFFFHGIVGHVKDRWGLNIDGWKEASKLANYWRRYFDIAIIEEIPYSLHSTDADDMSTMGNIGEPIPSVPMQISQLAHILYQALIWFLLPRRGPERKNWHLGGRST